MAVILEFGSTEAMVECLDKLVTGRDLSRELKSELVILPRPSGAAVVVPERLYDDRFRQVARFHQARESTTPNGAPPGRGLSAWLQGLPLCHPPTEPRHIARLFVAVQSAQPDLLDEETWRIYRSFPPDHFAGCRFILHHQGDDKRIWNLVLFELEQNQGLNGIARWIAELPKQTATAYCPFELLNGSAQDVFFCAWHCTHPVTALSRLYDARGKRFILMGPGVWLAVSEDEARKSFYSARQVYALEAGQDRPLILMAGQEPQPLVKPLRVNRSPFAIRLDAGSLAGIIAQRQKLQDMVARHEAGQRLATGRCRMALAFRHQGTDRKQLPPRLQAYLDKPCFTLDGHTYAYLEDHKGAGWHVLFSRKSMPVAEAVAAGADEVYMQDPRWLGAGLPIFVPVWLDLAPRLDDLSLAGQFRDFLKPRDGAGDARPECCLLLPPDHACGAADKFTALWVRETVPLPQQIQFFNEHFAEGTIAAVNRVPGALLASQEAHGLRVTEEMESLQALLLALGDTRTKEIEREWAAFSARARLARQALVAAGNDLQAIQDLLRDLRLDWAHFVDRVLTLHASLATRAGFAALQTEVAGFTQRAADARTANSANAADAICQAAATLRAETQQLAVDQNVAAATYDALQQQCQEHQQARQEVERKVAAMDDRLAHALNAARQANGVLKEDLRRKAKALSGVRDENERLEKDLEATEEALRQTQAANEQLAARNARRAKELERAKAKLQAVRLQTARWEAQFEQVQTSLDEQELAEQQLAQQVEDVNRRLKASYAEIAALHPQVQNLERQHQAKENARLALLVTRAQCEHDLTVATDKLRQLRANPLAHGLLPWAAETVRAALEERPDRRQRIAAAYAFYILLKDAPDSFFGHSKLPPPPVNPAPAPFLPRPGGVATDE